MSVYFILLLTKQIIDLEWTIKNPSFEKHEAEPRNIRSKESTAVLPGLNRKQIRYTVAKVTTKRVNKNRRRKSLRNHLAPDAFPDVRAVGDLMIAT